MQRSDGSFAGSVLGAAGTAGVRRAWAGLGPVMSSAVRPDGARGLPCFKNHGGGRCPACLAALPIRHSRGSVFLPAGQVGALGTIGVLVNLSPRPGVPNSLRPPGQWSRPPEWLTSGTRSLSASSSPRIPARTQTPPRAVPGPVPPRQPALHAPATPSLRRTRPPPPSLRRTRPPPSLRLRAPAPSLRCARPRPPASAARARHPQPPPHAPPSPAPVVIMAWGRIF